MEESGEPHTEASADRGSWMKRRLREQRAQQKDSQHVHNIADERAKALLEYRARCTSARFWIQSELLDLRVGGFSHSSGAACSDNFQSNPQTGAATSHGENPSCLNPGVVGDLPDLIRQYLTCPLLSKLLQQDPILSGKLATLDRVLWQRRSKHETHTPGWMSHEPLCPECCSFGVPHGPSEAPSAVVVPVAPGSVNNHGTSRTSTMDSVVGNEGSAAAIRPKRAVEDESRPVTAWVSCQQCMEHFAYIVASLLVFLKPSELRDLAVERQESQCCGFIFCGRKNIRTPEKRRTALWRWTLDFGGSKALSEEELVQFCCSRCCNRQQQLLRLLDEEPMYTRPGIKEWIGDALQRKAAYRPHPHGFPEGVPKTEASSRVQEKQPGESGSPDSASVLEISERRGVRPALEMNELLNDTAERLMEPIVEKRVPCVSFSTESSSAELTKLDDREEADGTKVPVTVEDDSSADEAPTRGTKNQDGQSVCLVEGRSSLARQAAVPLTDKRGGAVGSSSILLLDYNSASGTGEPARTVAPTANTTALQQPQVACEAVTAKAESPAAPEKAASSSPIRKFLQCPNKTEGNPAEEKQQEERGEPSLPHAAGLNSQTEPPVKSRGSRVRFADDDEEDGADGDGDGDSGASVFKHFFNLHDDDDGPGFYNRFDRQAVTGSTHAAGSQLRNGTVELRSILKPSTEPVDPSPPPTSSTTEAQVGYMRLSDVVIAFDLLSSCCTDASAKFLAGYHRRYCTCLCEGATPASGETSFRCSESGESPKREMVAEEDESRSFHLRKASEADESDNVACVDGESGDDIEPTDLWKRRQQQLLKAILRSLPPSADSFIPLITELCETLQPLQVAVLGATAIVVILIANDARPQPVAMPKGKGRSLRMQQRHFTSTTH
ncbi:hypothetical protein, conserved [Eimeria tenella]|uniref:RNA polymerase II subunit B1 CTD phosphatase RPAP2 homolog n=1 Tax=Eimeria tenella TaxID=5802 RepID=U6KRR4_EIMTE|nr:hypothetical protein, conserved [Eimeria tenella]CDJ39039.1 hypothetical protein, conserved [Eimeria tenella]|eukprot:XP_013229794.1 hypothetical protein, conserved [Eimeria tenella]